MIEEKHLLELVKNNFVLDGEVVHSEKYGCGHINQTYLLCTDTGKRYILQRISDAFDPDKLMENVKKVIDFIAENAGKDSTMHLVNTKDNKSFYKCVEGSFRIYDFVENSIVLQNAETKEDFYQSAIAFGGFQNMLSDFPAETLNEPIPNFHNTIDRYRIFHKAIAEDKMGRLDSVREEVEFALEREEEAGTLQRMRESGILPTRVTHNDTKLNNVLLDSKTRKPLCVIDLDTVMPGLSLYDYGDSIRFGAATAAEDEKDLSKMEMDLDLFAVYTRGFMEACPKLTSKEIEMMPMGAKTMTLECGVRFLTDYLEGDHYFATHREGQNLDRARTQFKLVKDMEDKWEKMKKIVSETETEVC